MDLFNHNNRANFISKLNGGNFIFQVCFFKCKGLLKIRVCFPVNEHGGNSI